MSTQDYNTVRRLRITDIPNSPRNCALVKQYAMQHCTGAIQAALLKLVAE